MPRFDRGGGFGTLGQLGSMDIRAPRRNFIQGPQGQRGQGPMMGPMGQQQPGLTFRPSTSLPRPSGPLYQPGAPPDLDDGWWRRPPQGQPPMQMGGPQMGGGGMDRPDTQGMDFRQAAELYRQMLVNRYR